MALAAGPDQTAFVYERCKHGVDGRTDISVTRMSLCNARPSTITKALLVYHIALVIAFGYAFFPYTLFYGLWLTSIIFIFAVFSLLMKKAILLYPFLIWVAITFVLFIILGAYLFFYSIFVSKSSVKDAHDSSVTSIVIHLTNVIFCLFHLWQIHVVDLCRKELELSSCADGE
ncbi:unnamed protein product [Toxocara canis]|uniref:MARVEL domain-containing protein n=1 Tax=Toxocara canis TaxID=6265 RepID=A0A183TYA1_TOXCA|nr:unnamed protein product [Toxocara canis]